MDKLTVTGLVLALIAIIGGSIVIETLFQIPGMGFLSYEAVFTRDYPLLMGVFLLASVSVIMANLIVDLLYGLLDPRVRLR